MNKRVYYVNPIVDWLDQDVWDFIKSERKLSYCSLYDEGFKRLGCVMCPLSSNQKKEALYFPKFAKAYQINFRRMYRENMEGRWKEKGITGKIQWKNGDEWYQWWMGEYVRKTDPDQLVMFE